MYRLSKSSSKVNYIGAAITESKYDLSSLYGKDFKIVENLIENYIAPYKQLIKKKTIWFRFDKLVTRIDNKGRSNQKDLLNYDRYSQAVNQDGLCQVDKIGVVLGNDDNICKVQFEIWYHEDGTYKLVDTGNLSISRLPKFFNDKSKNSNNKIEF